MICVTCGLEFGGQACPRCKPNQETLAGMLRSPGDYRENSNVLDLKSKRCRFCLKQLTCSIIRRAKAAPAGQIVGGLFLAKEYSESGVWQAVLDCRKFERFKVEPKTRKKKKESGFVGDLFVR